MNALATEPILDVVIGCDCDPDRPAFGGARYDTKSALSWRGIEEGVPRLREVADRIVDDFGNPVRLTWCIRSDLQMREIYGDCAWAAAAFASTWSELESAGDELAWHPHVWRWDDRAHCWYQEIEDYDWIAECFEAGHRALSRQVRHEPLTSRTGWEFHNNATMDAIRRLGLRVDFSAIPGCYTSGCSDRWGSRFCCHVDWRGTPEQAYRPSTSDYRHPAAGDEPGSLLELPMTVLGSRLLGCARIFRKVCRGRRGAARELGAVLGPRDGGASFSKMYVTMPPLFFSRLAAAQIGRARKSGYATLVTALHPDEMCVTGRSLTAMQHPRHLETNLIGIVRRARCSGVRVRFTTPAAMLDPELMQVSRTGSREGRHNLMEQPGGAGTSSNRREPLRRCSTRPE